MPGPSPASCKVKQGHVNPRDCPRPVKFRSTTEGRPFLMLKMEVEASERPAWQRFAESAALRKASFKLPKRSMALPRNSRACPQVRINLARLASCPVALPHFARGGHGVGTGAGGEVQEGARRLAGHVSALQVDMRQPGP